MRIAESAQDEHHQPGDATQQQQDWQPDDREPDARGRKRLEDVHEAGGRLVDDLRRLQLSVATRTATTGTLKLAVMVAYDAWSLSWVSCAVSCSIWPRTLVSCASTSSTSEMRVARLEILQGSLARAQVLDSRLEIDDSASNLDRIRVLRDDLAAVPGQAAEQVERILPARDGDPVRDRGLRAVLGFLRLRCADVAAHRPDAIACRGQCHGHVGDLELHRPGPDDLRVVDLLADLIGDRLPLVGGAGGAGAALAPAPP